MFASRLAIVDPCVPSVLVQVGASCALIEKVLVDSKVLRPGAHSKRAIRGIMVVGKESRPLNLFILDAVVLMMKRRKKGRTSR